MMPGEVRTEGQLEERRKCKITKTFKRTSSNIQIYEKKPTRGR